MLKQLPPSFDVDYYREVHPDLRLFSIGDAIFHYTAHGKSEGRVASAAQLRENFLNLIDKHLDTLEIGPFTKPALRGSKIAYFDVADRQALLARAELHQFPIDNPPEIDSISSTGDLQVITRSFDKIFSSHCIEHAPDLVMHLQGLSSRMKLDGPRRLFLLIPDKRYCFDHFIENSSIADVIGAHIDGRKLHAPSSIIEHRSMLTHNDPARHWAGDHGASFSEKVPHAIQAAYAEASATREAYVDVHAWQFTPDSFSAIINQLAQLELIDFEIEQVYQTPRNRLEFAAVLRKRVSGGDAF